jgi:cell division protein FtsW (lipid II flippase)
MTTAQAWIGYGGTLALATVLAGVLVRGHYRIWWFFSLFLAVTLVSTVMILAWPSRFYTTHFWQAKETVLNFVRFAMALELAYRTFRAFPGALATARWLMLLVLAVTFAAVVMVPGGGTDYQSFLAELHPRVLNGSIWLFTAIAALILWYRLPVDSFHKAVLLGYVPFLLIFTVCINVLGTLGRSRWERGWPVLYLNQFAYLALMIHWARAAWRRAGVPARPPEAPTSFDEAVSA